jgi:hypothetical protein
MNSDDLYNRFQDPQPLRQRIRNQLKQELPKLYQKLLTEQGIILSRAESQRLLIAALGDVLEELRNEK